jgi:glucokinase
VDYVAGVDLGGTKILTALAGADGNIVRRVKVATGAARGLDAVLDRMVESVREAAAGVTLAAVGVGAPGPLDHTCGLVYDAPNLGWRDVPLGGMLRDRLGVPVFVENDANCAALGEYKRGAGQNCGHMVYVTVSTGIGGGLILDGRIYHGEAGGAGEIGHMILDPLGPPCNCGRNGCLEAFASGTAIAREARAARDGPLAGLETVTARDVAAAARQGDPQAGRIMRDAFIHLGRGLAAVITLLNPRLVVVGGGVMAGGSGFLGVARAEAARWTYGPAWERVEVVPALLGPDSGVVGAVALARRE